MIRKTIAILSFALMTSVPAHAQGIVFDGGQMGTDFNDWGMVGPMAVNFQLSGTTTLTSMTFLTHYLNPDPSQPGDPNLGFLGHLIWGVYTDDGAGLPGSLLMTRDVATPIIEPRGPLRSKYTIGLPNLGLEAGSYFISITNQDANGNSPYTGMRWSGPPGFIENGELPAARFDPVTGTWKSLPSNGYKPDFYGNRLAFTLSGYEGATSVTTPEPSSLALLGTGLLGLVPLIRRRTR